jgi:centromeric protein E
LVDLAGSEGASRTHADGLRLREGSNINRSLLALSNVINRLSTANGGKAFINFRDSKLTRILQPALGGNSKTAIICTMTPTLANYQESVNTLHFGQKAKHVKTTVNVNEITQGMLNGTAGPELEKA